MQKQIKEPLLQDTPTATIKGSIIGWASSQIGIEDDIIQDHRSQAEPVVVQEEAKDPNVLIDFHKEMQNLKKNTEISAPWIQTVTEDAMFLTKTQVVTLEFHKYQSNQKYIKLDSNIPEDFEEHSHSHMADNKFCTNLFPTRAQMADKNQNTMFYGNDPDNDENENVKSYIPQEMRLNDPKIDNLMKVENLTEDQLEIRAIEQRKALKTPRNKSKSKTRQPAGSIKTVETNYAEGVISLYQINQKGCMKKVNEVSLHMNNRFQGSKDGNMTLTRSTDKKVFSIVNFDRYDSNDKFFNFHAWRMNLKTWLPHSGSYDALNEGLNQYYKKVINNFDKLESVQLVGQCHIVKLEYIEKELTNEEMDALVMKIFKYNRSSENEKGTVTPGGVKPPRRKVRKYVFFNVDTGEIVFEYGGINKKQYTGQVEAIKSLIFDPAETGPTQDKKIFELSLQVKEIKEEKFKTQFAFYYTGDFLNDEIRENQLIFSWSVNFVLIPMSELFAISSKGQQSMMNMVYERIYKQIQEVKADPYNLDCYVFDQNVIEKQLQSWEQCITVSTNRTFNQFMIINHPLKKLRNCYNTVYVNGPLFLQNEDLANKTANDARVEKTSEIRQRRFEVPFFSKLPSKPDDMIIEPGRNNFIKEELYYNIIAHGKVKPFCLRLTENDHDSRVKQVRLEISNFRSQPDVMLNYNKNFKEDFQVDVFQTVHVSNAQAQCAILQTRLPTKISDRKVKNYENIERRSSQSSQLITNFPILAYNLGDQKLAFHCLLGNHIGKNYLIDLGPNERFLGFIEFNSFEDIGFYPTNLKIECCSSFLYMTTCKTKCRSAKKSNKIYLILVDPYYKDVEVVRFKSSQYFENQIMTQDDFIVKQIVQNSMVRKSPTSVDCKTFIWAQFPKDLVMVKLKNLNTVEEVQTDSDSSENEMNDDKVGPSNDFEDLMPGVEKKVIQDIEIKQDSCDFIYYVVCQNEELKVMEINPRDNSYDKHLCIYRHISDKCRAFTIKNSDCFFLVDNKLNIFKLSRGEQSRFLKVERRLALKEIQRAEFSPRPFEKLICRESYAICKSKIFYFFDVKEGPKTDGLMDSEDLIDTRTLKKMDPNINYELVKGPILITGSSRFFCIFKLTNGKDLPKYIYWVMHRLEQAQKTLVNDPAGNVKFSTFLNNGNILVQCQHRFLVFTCKGSYIEEADFENEQFFFQKTNQNTPYGEQPDQAQGFMFNNVSIEDGEEDSQYCAREAFNQSEKQLLQISQCNKYFVFYDSRVKKILVYELICQYGQTSFSPMYELSHTDNVLFSHLMSKNIDPIEYFKSNPGQIRVTNDGKVKVCYTEFMEEHEVEEHKDEIYETARRKSCCKIAPRNEFDFNDKGMIYCKIFGTFFRQLEGAQSKTSAVRNFYDTFLFPNDAIKQMNETQQNKIEEKIRKLNRIEYTQSMIPDIYKNFNEQENLAREIERLQKTQRKSTQINAKIFFDKLVLIYGGRYIKFGHLTENPVKRLPDQKNYNYFIFKEFNGQRIMNLNADLSKNEEVIKITETDSARSDDPSKNFHLAQITTKDWDNKIMKLISWNFDLNIEDSNLQMPYDPQVDSGHLIKGMNEKRNYYYSNNFIIDLEYNIPILQRNLDQSLDFKTQNYISQVQTLDIMINQRKLYYDKTQFLGIERPNILYNSLCKLDVLLWRNIQDLGSRPEDINALISVDSINLNFSGNSLFHYFADDPDVIQIFYDKFKEEEAKGTLSSQSANLPLQILNPNNQGFTALQIANQKQQPRSLEIMFMLIQYLPNYAITKMFIAEMPMLLAHESDTILSFFEKSFFAPMQMRLPQFVPWDSDAPELIFACHTSLMSKNLLITKMKEQGYCAQDYGDEKEEKEEAPAAEPVEEKQNLEDNTNSRPIIPKRSLNFAEQIASQEEFQDNQLTRVEIQSIDMDWLFIDQNAKQLLEILAEKSNPSVLVKAQIRIFVDLMWSQYKPNIINYIFLPYIGYLIVLLYMSASIIGPYHRSLEEPLTPEEHYVKFATLKWVTMITLFVATCFLNMNIILELQQVQKNGMEYFESYWNLIDICSLMINFLYIASFAVNFQRAQEFFPVEVIRIFGGFAAFTMWIKIFYWMRLFPDLAYYVKLISQTILDSMNFSLLVLIILISFANFFYIINRSNDESGDVNYVPEVTGFHFLDSILDVYLMGALGAFDPATYQNGYGAKFAIPMLFLATFIISIVFMNMLIAIMGETFAQVQESAEENGLLERVSLINDFIWLIDLKKIFKGQKYIIQVKPMKNQIEELTGVDIKLQEIDTCLTTLIQNEHFNLKQIISRTDDKIQKNQNDLVKTQEWMMRQIKTVKNQLKDQQTKEEELNQDKDVSAEPINYSYLSIKTLEIIIALNKQFNDVNVLDTSQEGIYDIALDWVDLVDKNNQGGIDLTEFYRSFSSIDDILVSDQDIVNIFRMFDVNNDGDISVQELARAIKKTIDFCMQEGGQELFDKLQDEKVEEEICNDGHVGIQPNMDRDKIRQKAGLQKQSLK